MRTASRPHHLRNGLSFLVGLAGALFLLTGCCTKLAAPMGPHGLRIEARPYWTDTHVDVVKDQRLSLVATGSWTDHRYDADANGYVCPEMQPFERLRRRPEAPWFSLIGCIERRRDLCFVIGTRAQITAPASGRLYVFANDVPGFYFNNSGALTLVVDRHPPAGPPPQPAGQPVLCKAR